MTQQVYSKIFPKKDKNTCQQKDLDPSVHTTLFVIVPKCQQPSYIHQQRNV